MYAPDTTVRSTIDEWLLAEYAYSTSKTPRSTHFEMKTFFADRYGGEGVGSNGGSGRCGIGGLFNVKGIGATPLSRVRGDPFHSNGILTLDEAVREAILAEVCRQELPFSAVPVIAVIVTGTIYTYEKDGITVNQPCALVVRPNFVRPAYLLRAIYFGDSLQEWLPDEKRVRDAVAALAKYPELRTLLLEVHGFDRFIDRVSAQIAYGLVHRLTHGSYSLSNMSLHGELVDFGAASALPTWGAAEVSRSDPPFGIKQFGRFLSRASDIHRKLVMANSPFSAYSSFGDLCASASAAFDSQFRAEIFRCLGLPMQSASGERAVQSTLTLMRLQQAHCYPTNVATIDGANSWFYGQDQASASSAKEPASGLICELLRLSQAHVGRRYLTPRPGLYKAEQFERLRMVCLGLANDPGGVERLIDTELDVNIRRWAGPAESLVVRGHLFLPTYGAQWCSDPAGKRHVMVLQAPQAGGRVAICKQDLEASQFDGDERIVWIISRLPTDYLGEAVEVPTLSATLRIPALTVFY